MRQPHSIRSYVLRQGRPTKAQQRAWTLHANTYLIPPVAESPPDWQTVFGRSAPLIIEIGCGYGEATATLAQANPDNDYVVFEVHRPGIGALMNHLATEGLNNVRIVNADAMVALPTLFVDAMIAGAHIFFPDPWPKKRQQKRRLIRPEFITVLAKKCAAGGYVHFVTDWREYADTATAVFADNADFVRQQPPPPPPTAYARRATAAGREIIALSYRRSSGACVA